MTAIYQIDAFASQVFEGNPAAVVPLDRWPADSLLQSIAAENNLAETAFIVNSDSQWEIRWFTPTREVALCGHATLAAAHVAFEHLKIVGDDIDFVTRESGTLNVKRRGDGQLSMGFPAIETSVVADASSVAAALGKEPASLRRGSYTAEQFDYLAIFSAAEAVAALKPDATQFAALGSRGIIASAPGGDYDFISRYFAPAYGIAEDPVTGSTHCLMTPYWAARLGKLELSARQMSARSGTLQCRLDGRHVELTGRAIDYLHGHISVPGL